MLDLFWRRSTAVLVATLAFAGCGGSDDDGGGGGGGGTSGPSLEVRGVNEPVEIVRDRHGVSHIYANNQRDLFFAQGWNAARDRLWQLDQWRRQGEGKMAEQFGARFAAADRAARLFLYRGDLEQEYASYHPDAKEILTAFAEGINAFIAWAKADPQQRMPIEFRLTGTEPGDWSPTSSLIRIYGITRNVGTEVTLSRRIAAVGAAKTIELTVFEPPITDLPVPAGIDPATITTTILGDYNLARNGVAFQASDFPRSPLSMADRERLAAALSAGKGVVERSDEEQRALTTESNNWTVAGTKTDTGKPILSNDPHRAISMPSLRYMVHLNAPGWNFIGAGEPALPGVSMGHNERIAFGLTIFAYGDEEDLYVYETNPADRNQYRYQGGWETMRIVRETIKVRGQPDTTAELKFTRHGPVLFEDTANRRAYAVRAAYLEFPGTAAYLPSLRLNQARNWNEFVEGMARHYTPSENMVYADVDGNIGWFGGSIVPIRPRSDWSGLLPVPGDGRYEWAGFLPGSLLPRVFNPQIGFIATANEFNVPADYAYRDLTSRSGWAEPYRKQRIDEVLTAASRHTVQDSARLQYDDTVIPARILIPHLNGLQSTDADTAEALTLLRGWNRVASVDSVAASVFELWMPRVVARVTELMVPAAARTVFGTLDKRIVFAKLAAPDAVFGADPVAGRSAVLLETLKAAMTDLRARQGDDRSRWNWGSLHHIQFEHALAPFLSPQLAETLATARFPVSGTNDTVHRATYRTSDFRVTSGASYRQVIDVSDWDKSLALNLPGQSSDPQSPYYKNLIEPWAKGEFFPMAYSRARVDALKADSVTLRPAPRP